MNSETLWQEYQTQAEIEESSKRVLTQVQRMKIGQRMKRFKARMKMARKRALRKMASKDTLLKRATKSARMQKFKQFSQGKSPSELSPGQRQIISNRLAKLSPILKRIATRLVKDKRKQELARHRKG